MTQPDENFRLSYAWFQESVDRALSESNVPSAQREQAAALLFKLVGLNAAGALPANPQLEDFAATAAGATSIAYAGLIVAESIAAVDTVSRIVTLTQSDPGGGLGDATKLIGDVIKQVDGIVHQIPPKTLPSAFGLAKILLTLSGDSHVLPAVAVPRAKLLAEAIAGTGDSNRTQNVSAGLALLTMVLGAIIDHAFTAPSAADAGWIANAALAAAQSDFPTLTLPLNGLGGAAAPSVSMTLEKNAGGTPTAVRAVISKALDATTSASGLAFGIGLAGRLEAQLPLAGGKPSFTTNPPQITISASKKKAGGALVIGPVGGATLRIGEIGATFTLAPGNPALSFFVKDGRVELTIQDSFLADVLKGAAAIDFNLSATADAQGGLRLDHGSGMKVTLPVPAIPTGPFKIQLITFGIEPDGGNFDHLRGELSAAFSVDAGPFKASVEGLGISVDMNHLLNGTPSLGVSLKPPNGIGLALDTGAVSGGGYLYIDTASGTYAGALELKVMQIGVKAIAILSTQSPAGWSLLLLIYGQFPPIQLSWGFTLTGIGGLIGVQHTLDTTALSQGLSTGALDAILFPDDPVGNAPQIINKLQTLFPVLRGGFIIGPMLEVGWGTPSLVTVRLGLLIEATQISLLGQAIVQLPPLVKADLALLHLQADFAGYVKFDPLAIGFDAVLRDSRVLMLTLTGQFAFRLQTGPNATFLISAGGFHPQFHDVPDDVPQPFQRVGCGFDIGIIRIDFKGYFAVTAATVQSGADLRISADLGVAGIEGGFGYDAICYLQPRFYFQIDLHAYVTVKILSGDFAGIRVTGTLSGPGRWHIAGTGVLELPIVPDISIDFDEHWGSDTSTPSVTENVAQLLADEIAKQDNWSAVLPQTGESYVSLAPVTGLTDILAHPCGVLQFRQKLIPLNQDLQHVGIAAIDGANRFGFGRMLYDSQPANNGAMQALQDPFSASQFFNVQDQERLQGASFCSYDSGVAFASDDYVFDDAITETLDYEQAYLGPSKSKLIVAFHLGDLASGAWVVTRGAAARSPMRDAARVLPAAQTRFAVDPAPVVITDRSSAAQATSQVFTNYWQARNTIGASPQLDSGLHQVAELFELG